MYRRFLAIALLLATIVQGSALAYATTSGACVGHTMNHHCDGRAMTGAHEASGGCCSPGATLSCAEECSVSSSVALPMTPPTMQRTVLTGVIVRDAGVAPFAEHAPPHPLRPPIL